MNDLPFVQHNLILKHGLKFTKKIDISSVPAGEPGLCYQNAYKIAKDYGYIYCEGYSVSSKGFNFPVEHAWCVTKDQDVIDNTWDNAGITYFGIPFNMSYCDFMFELIGNYGIFGWLSDTIIESGFPNYAVYQF